MNGPEGSQSGGKSDSKVFRVMAMVLRLVVILAVVAITFYALSVREQLAELGRFGYPGIFLIQLLGSSAVVVPIPSAVVTIIGGAVYNPVYVGCVAGTAAAIGEMVSYVTGRMGTAVVENREMYNVVKRWMDRHDLLVLFLMALIPNPFFDVAGIIAGVLNIPPYRYFLITLPGQVIKFILIAYLGSVLPWLMT